MERIERIRAAGNNNNGPVGRYHQPPLPPPITGDVVNELRHLIDQSDCYTVETIELGYRLTVFANLLHGYVMNDEARLSDLFAQLNETALSDDQFAPKMAFVFSSQQLGALSPLDQSIRNAMITKLQDNYGAKDRLKQAGRHRFYNSITLLGEYYHRKRDAHGKRFHILGEKLLALLTSELEQEIKLCGKQQQEQHHHSAYTTIDPAFAKVILSQITLNGEVAREELRQEITELMLMVRKCLLTVSNLCEWTKAFLLMALDFYHANLPQDVFDRLYTKYLVEEPKPDPEPAPAPVPVMMESPVPAPIPVDAPYYEPLSPEPAIGYLEDESVDGLRTHTGHVTTNHHHLPPLSPSPTPLPQAQLVAPAPLEAPPKERNAVSNKENKRRPPSRHEQARARHSSNQRKKVEEPESGVGHTVTSPPTTPTSKKQGTTVPPRTVTLAERTPPDGKKPIASPPRAAEKLANLPKLTVTTTNTAAQSRKPSTAAAPLSPRGVLVVSSGRQQPAVQPPKSPSSRAAAARNGGAAGATNNNTKASQQSDQYTNSSSNSRRGGGGNDRRIPSKYIIPRFAAQQRKEQEARAANAAHAAPPPAAAGAPLRNGSAPPSSRGGGGNVLKQQQQQQPQQQQVKNPGTGPKANGQTDRHQRPPRSPSKTKPSDWYSHDDRRRPASRSSRKQEQPKKNASNGDGSGGQLGGKAGNPPQNPVWDWAAEDDYYETDPRTAPERDGGVAQRKELTINWASEEDAKPVTNTTVPPPPTKPIVWDWAADDDDYYEPVTVNGGPAGNSVRNSKPAATTAKTQPSPPRPPAPPREPKKWDWAADEDEEDDYVAYRASAGSSNSVGGGLNLPERDIGALSTAYNERLSLDDDRRSSRKPNPNAHA
uniref:Putative serine/arginine repetitive matrix protein 1 n=1 Tax=Anopheles triannulatus TaxID=58253 RepID=A0A2M4ACX6_9DIPT